MGDWEQGKKTGHGEELELQHGPSPQASLTPQWHRAPCHYLAVHEHAEGQGDAELCLLGTATHATGSIR